MVAEVIKPIFGVSGGVRLAPTCTYPRWPNADSTEILLSDHGGPGALRMDRLLLKNSDNRLNDHLGRKAALNRLGFRLLVQGCHHGECDQTDFLS